MKKKSILGSLTLLTAFCAVFNEEEAYKEAE